MRKIIFAILFGLIFLATSFARPESTALATSCCSGGYVWCGDEGEGGPGCYKDRNCYLPKDQAKFSCSATEKCTSSSQTCEAKTQQATCPTNLPTPASNGLCCPARNAPLNLCKKLSDVGVCKNDKTTIYERDGTVCKATKRTPVALCVGGEECVTAIGSINTTPGGFITSLLKYALPFAILILLLALIYVGYIVITSRGNPEKLQVAKEITVSVITGFLLLAFSFVILNIIGQSFLGITATP